MDFNRVLVQMSRLIVIDNATSQRIRQLQVRLDDASVAFSMSRERVPLESRGRDDWALIT